MPKGKGHPLPDTPEMQMWRQEYEKMSLEEHNQKLKQLGLEDEEIQEFDEKFLELKKQKKS
jgi:hypothetical protein